MNSDFNSAELLVHKAIQDHEMTIKSLRSESRMISILGLKISETILNGKKMLIFGNGGSAADAQHIAAEIVGRFKMERPGLPCIALTTDCSILTAVGNDYGFKFIFSRQVDAISNDGDLVLGISTSGNSENVIEGISAANKKNCFTAALTGKSGGVLSKNTNLCIKVPSDNTATIQECHILIGHILCSIIDPLHLA